LSNGNFEIETAMAIECLARDNGVIVVPTDTTYGVICRLDRLQAIDRIYELKGRDRSKPLIILGHSVASLLPFVEGDRKNIEVLGGQFWPGALTIVARSSMKVPPEIMSGGTTVGLRVPDHKGLLRLLSLLPDGAVASTSANLSGAPTPKVIDEVIASLSDKIDYILPDCDESPAGTESTIIDVTSSEPKILRAGALDKESIVKVLKR